MFIHLTSWTSSLLIFYILTNQLCHSFVCFIFGLLASLGVTPLRLRQWPGLNINRSWGRWNWLSAFTLPLNMKSIHIKYLPENCTFDFGLHAFASLLSPCCWVSPDVLARLRLTNLHSISCFPARQTHWFVGLGGVGVICNRLPSIFGPQNPLLSWFDSDGMWKLWKGRFWF